MSRSRIPPDLKREVREACGYGCVICGHPLYQMDHITEHAVVQEHELSNLALLCATHHDEKGGGFTTADQIRDARNSPVNLQTETTPPWSLTGYGSEPIDVVVGGNRFTSVTLPLVIDKQVILGVRFENGRALLMVDLLDEFNLPYLMIFDNELTHRTSGLDFELIRARPPHVGRGPRLIIRRAPGDIVLEIEFRPPKEVIFVRGSLMANGVQVDITEDHISVGGHHFSGHTARGGDVGIAVGETPSLPGHILVSHVRRYPIASVDEAANATSTA